MLEFLIVFKFLIRLIQNTSNPHTPSVDSLYKNFSSYLLAHFYLMKIRQSRLLPPFGDIKPPSKQNNTLYTYFPHFLETGSLKNRAVCAHTTSLPKK
jgi:hypothetical protein